MFETVRLCHFHSMMEGVLERDPGFDHIGFLEGTGIGPILKSTSCDYKFPGSYPDDVICGSRVDKSSIKDSEFQMEYICFSEAKGRTLATGTGLIVTYDYGLNRRAKIPRALEQALRVDGEGGVQFY